MNVYDHYFAAFLIDKKRIPYEIIGKKIIFDIQSEEFEQYKKEFSHIKSIFSMARILRKQLNQNITTI